MQVTELDELIVKLIVDSGHPEIDSVERVPTPGRPDNHTRLVVRFASGASATIMVPLVTGGGVSHERYQLPAGVL
ncbi:hypothetical protein EV191_10419 [Tamaricihabitans halophyticus]|uniref:Uncharacterized protein n=1 Tax=Tamaricihabitans halophyticus TaxID=1262583 RepID=A0A4R2QU13_9PSEU|nr:hypothetical protein [Tamaricihabitans halophyticus]TCP53452.1 hypothetical protein EV191_10419 [Tamaricihabitans halophyticus]